MNGIEQIGVLRFSNSTNKAVWTAIIILFLLVGYLFYVTQVSKKQLKTTKKVTTEKPATPVTTQKY